MTSHHPQDRSLPAEETPRTDPSRDRRRYAWYFGGLLVVYLGALVAFWPGGNAEPDETIYLFVMFAPTVGALLARFLGPGKIQWGRPTWWILVALAPVVAVLGAYLLGYGIGWYAADFAVLRSALTGSVMAILSAAILAVGEEIGWRGFLWPLLRTRMSFLRAALIVGIVWWLYHVPFVFFGWYGSVGGLPAFTVGLAGFTLFAGVLTDRSKSVWPSVTAHAAWNALIATSFSVEIGGVDVPAFTGNDALLGEFGWIAAVTVLLIGVGAAWWHLRDSGVRKTAV